MIDLDALELPEGEPITGYVHVETKAYRALITELREKRESLAKAEAAWTYWGDWSLKHENQIYRLETELAICRRGVEAAAAIPRLKVSLGSWEREKYAAIGEQLKALYAALAELEALK